MDEELIQEQTTEPQYEPLERNEPGDRVQRSKFLVFIFSLVPGAGHMYLGVQNRGLQLMLLFFGTLFIGNLVGHPLNDFWTTVVAPVVWFYSFFDSLQTAGKLERHELVDDRPVPFFESLGNVKWGTTAGWILVGLGMLALANNLGFLMPDVTLWIRRLLGPALLVGIGLWLLLREQRREPEALPEDFESVGTDEEEP